MTNQAGATLNNQGELSNIVFGTLSNAGTLNNIGTLRNNAFGYVVSVTNEADGLLNNTGSFYNYAAAPSVTPARSPWRPLGRSRAIPSMDMARSCRPAAAP